MWVRWNVVEPGGYSDCGASINTPVVKSPQRVNVEAQSLTLVEASADALEAGVLGGAGQQARNVGDHAVHPLSPLADRDRAPP